MGEREMTKKELIEALTDFPDHYEVHVSDNTEDGYEPLKIVQEGVFFPILPENRCILLSS